MFTVSWALFCVLEAAISKADMAMTSWGSHSPIPSVGEGDRHCRVTLYFSGNRNVHCEISTAERESSDRWAGDCTSSRLIPRASQRRWFGVSPENQKGTLRKEFPGRRYSKAKSPRWD